MEINTEELFNEAMETITQEDIKKERDTGNYCFCEEEDL